ncbi:MAG: diguanylate cyclase [Bilophila wadsworthia]
MSIRWVTSLLGLLLTVTIMVTAGLSWNVYSSFTKMVEADVQYLNLMQVSRELLQSSYDLTRKAREYVNTGDEASERAYYDILAQRSGRVPRKSSLAPGETISLPSLLERYGASRGDMEFLATALRRSDALSITEIEAMQASKGEALCPDGLHSGSDTIDVEYARRLLFNAAYQKRAGEIIKLVESGITSILDRKSHQIEAYKRSVVYHMKELGASIAVVFLIALMWIWYGMKKVSQPLRETTLFAHRVAEGEAESSIAVSGHDEIAELRAMLNVMLSSLQKNALMLRELSYIDPLTALWNRRRFRRCCPMSCGACRKKGKGFGLAFIDVDCFKGINDTFGHAAGDMVLREFAKLARGMLPDSATFARLGGDEFVLLLPDADEGALFRQLEEIRVACTAMPLVHADREVRFSISAGGYRFTSSGPSIRPRRTKDDFDLFRYADSALYMSKQAGRDRVTLWSPDCSFPCAEGRWKEQSVSDDVC